MTQYRLLIAALLAAFALTACGERKTLKHLKLMLLHLNSSCTCCTKLHLRAPAAEQAAPARCTKVITSR